MTRALLAVAKAGMTVARVEISQNGNVVVIPGPPPTDEPRANNDENDFGSPQ